MKRRSFLKSAAALLPAAALPEFALAQPAAAPSSKEVYVIGAGNDRLGETHSLGYSTILFKVLPSETNSGLFVIEHLNLMKGGPSLHYHLYQEEYFYVLEGEVLFQLGENRRKLVAGESVVGPRNIPHTFSGAGEKPARMLISFTPAGKMEQFFRANAVPNAPPPDAAAFSRYDIVYVGPSPLHS